MFDGEWRMALEPMQGNPASSWVDLLYMQLFCFAGVTPGSLYTCYSILGDCLEFHQEVKAPLMFDGYHRIALHATQWNRASSHGKGKVSWFFSAIVGNLGYIVG